MPTSPVPEHLPGEPERPEKAAATRALRLAGRIATTALMLLATVWAWPLYFVLAARYGWAPIVPRLRQARRYLRLIWTLDPPEPGLRLGDRLWLTSSVLRLAALAPVFGSAWWIDELLYGDALRAVRVAAPLIEISAARSGSTQLARYLEEDPQLVAPKLLQIVFPFLWAWRLAPRTLGRLLSRDRVAAIVAGSTPAAFLERHESDPFRTDTLEVALLFRHLNHLALRLHPDAMAEDMTFGSLNPTNRDFWERDFVRFFDGVARKTLLDAGPGPDGRPRRLFIKGHFLAAAPFLARRHPDARFLTVIREPAPRIRSAINFLRESPFERNLGAPPPWGWLAAGLGASEEAYCAIEQAWFTRPDGPRRCVVRFSDYVKDLAATLAKVYRECLDRETVPDGAPREHEPRRRHDYSFDRSLAELGIDEAALNVRLADYIAWCRGTA